MVEFVPRNTESITAPPYNKSNVPVVNSTPSVARPMEVEIDMIADPPPKMDIDGNVIAESNLDVTSVSVPLNPVPKKAAKKVSDIEVVGLD